MNTTSTYSSTLVACMVRNAIGAASETFIDAQEKNLPLRVITLYGDIATYNDIRFFPSSLPGLISSKIERMIRGKNWEWTATQSYRAAFRKFRPDVVVAQFGPAGVRVAEACHLLDIPLIVYFRGYDAHRSEVLEKHQITYKNLFKQSVALIAVSKEIQQKLIDLGADPTKVIHQPSGVDCHQFQLTDPSSNPPIFVAVGRLVEKKAPHLTLLAFHQAFQQNPELRLHLIGDGPLSGVCHDLVTSLGLKSSVDLLGARPHSDVIMTMQRARGFIQHSVKAQDGDSEGTPNAVMEASASGLPVVATRHAGINDIIIDQETGFLVDERDIQSMASRILQLANDPALAAKLGRNGREYVCKNFSREVAHQTLYQIILAAVEKRPFSK